MRVLFISMCLLVVSFICPAQTSCNIKKAYAFYTVSVPGAQMSDDNGNPIPPKVDIARFIYIEWGGTVRPQIKTVLYNNRALAATLIAVKGRAVVPGSELSENNNFKITCKKGNSLWKIELQPQGDNSMPEQDCKNIIIKTNVNGKTCSFKLSKETQLMVLPRY